MSAYEALSRRAREARGNGIVEVADYGRDRPGIIPLWTGEGHRPTPAFICDAAKRSLDAGETFYTHQGGIPELREELARYHEFHYGGTFDPTRFLVTGSGMQAIQIAVTLACEPGDEIVYHAPAWPNLPEAAGLAGVAARPVAMTLTGDAETGLRWTLDLDALFAAVTPRTKALFLNTPSNPTGWVMPPDDMKAVLEFARQRGIWIVADEIYGRFCFNNDYVGAQGRPLAPSFNTMVEPEDQVLFVNTFSKNWAMTGWRVGWIGAPASLNARIEDLIQYATSGVAVFMQRAALAALRDGDDFSETVIEDARTGWAVLLNALGKSGLYRYAAPEGAFYGFFAIEGYPDTDSLGLTLVDEANIGLAPGRAFGAAGAGFMRLCFARDAASLAEALQRLNQWIAVKTRQ